jgi:hypothetical protein
MSDQLVAETSTRQHTTPQTNIHAHGGIRTHDRSRRTTVDIRRAATGTGKNDIRVLNTDSSPPRGTHITLYYLNIRKNYSY